MKYYKVKKEYDQIPMTYKNKAGYNLIADELFTETEHKNISCRHYDKAFEIVEISKFKTHWLFGARFA